jgi:hypothetical protein
MASNKFEVLIPGQGDYKSIKTPTTVTDWVRGLFLSADTSVSTDGVQQLTAKLAAAADNQILGFCSKAVTATGKPSDTEILYGGRLEGPVKAGQMLSVEPLPEMFYVEGAPAGTYLDDTNPLTAVGDLVNFIAGKARIAQTGQLALYVVTALEADEEGTANLRFVLTKIPGGKVA